jgi:hypothetical protein
MEAGQSATGAARSSDRRATVRLGARQMGSGGGRRCERRAEVRQVAVGGGNGNSVPPLHVKQVGRCLSIHLFPLGLPDPCSKRVIPDADDVWRYGAFCIRE